MLPDTRQCMYEHPILPTTWCGIADVWREIELLPNSFAEWGYYDAYNPFVQASWEAEHVDFEEYAERIPTDIPYH